MKKNILFILHIPPPVHGAAIVGRYIMESKVLEERFNCDFLNLTTSFRLDQIGKGAVQKVLTIVKILYRTIRYLLGKKYALCYMTLTASGAGFYKDMLIVLLLKLFRQNIMYHFHNKGVKKNSDSPFNRALYRFAFKNTTSILLSPELYSDIDLYVARENIHICPNGIPDIKDAITIVKPPTDLPRPIRLLFLSNMMKDKGVFDLLMACSDLQASGLSFECHFIGAWSKISETTFLEEAEKLGVSGIVHGHGKRYGAEKIAFFKETDIFILPTYNDCFPLVLLEAMQYSIPVIATFEGGIPTLVQDRETGLLIPSGDVPMLADSIRFFIENPEQGRLMGENGRLRYEKLFTLSKFEHNLKEILAQNMD